MSLKSVHVLFIVLATAMTVVFGMWSLRSYSTPAAVAAFVIAAALAGYGTWFVRKSKGMGDE